MKIFITGACGFVGWHLSTRLINDKKHELYLTDGFVGKQASLSLKREKRVNHPVHPIDINFPKLLAFKMAEFKPDVVVHLAALSGVREGQADAVSYIQTNVVGTSNVFEAAINAKAKHVLYASSASVYAGVDLQTWQPNIDERTFPAPTSIYGMTKFNNEVLAAALNKKQSDTTFTGLRFANVCGVYGRPESILYQMAKHIVLKRPIPIYGGENLDTIERQFTDVTFVAELIIELIRHKDDLRKYPLINIATKTQTSLAEMLEGLEHALGVKHVGLARTDGRLAEARQLVSMVPCVREVCEKEIISNLNFENFAHWYKQFGLAWDL